MCLMLVRILSLKYAVCGAMVMNNNNNFLLLKNNYGTTHCIFQSSNTHPHRAYFRFFWKLTKPRVSLQIYDY